jgi:hypothetical protein
MATKTNRSNILLNVDVCTNGDEADGDEANGVSGGEGLPRGVYFEDRGGREEAKGETLNF